MPYPRHILRLTGRDVKPFLQGITTQDVNRLATTPLLFTAFLSPQGKLLFDGFLIAEGDAILLDIAEAHRDLAQNYLTRYKLRADVQITDSGLTLTLGTGHPDPRHPALPARLYSSPNRGEAGRGAASGTDSAHQAPHPTSPLPGEEYHKKRLSLAIPESPYDTSGDDVAMDLAYDLLDAISFTKGCYVGQEVTARMKYKNIARRGIFHIAAETSLPPSGTPITAGEHTLGELRSSDSTQGIALLRYEPYEQARTEGLLITAGSIPLIVTVPAWAEPRLTLFRQGKGEL